MLWASGIIKQAEAPGSDMSNRQSFPISSCLSPPLLSPLLAAGKTKHIEGGTQGTHGSLLCQLTGSGLYTPVPFPTSRHMSQMSAWHCRQDCTAPKGSHRILTAPHQAGTVSPYFTRARLREER